MSRFDDFSFEPDMFEAGQLRNATFLLLVKRVDITGNIHSGLNVPTGTVIGRDYAGGKTDSRNWAAGSPQRYGIFPENKELFLLNDKLDKYDIIVDTGFKKENLSGKNR